jgi:hypothetical protein
VAAVAREAGALELSGPKEMPYGPGYYAIFFADPSGNRLEVYVRPPSTRGEATSPSIRSAASSVPGRRRSRTPAAAHLCASAASESTWSRAAASLPSAHSYVGSRHAVAGFGDALRVVVLVPEDRERQHRLAEPHALGRRVVAAVRDHGVDVRQHGGLRQELLARPCCPRARTRRAADPCSRRTVWSVRELADELCHEGDSRRTRATRD